MGTRKLQCRRYVAVWGRCATSDEFNQLKPQQREMQFRISVEDLNNDTPISSCTKTIRCNEIEDNMNAHTED